MARKRSGGGLLDRSHVPRVSGDATALRGPSERGGRSHSALSDVGFWSFVMAVAAQEGPETMDRMTKAAEAIHSEQSRSVNTPADDLLPLLHDWLSDQGKDTTRV